jgi:hypothetical protein
LRIRKKCSLTARVVDPHWFNADPGYRSKCFNDQILKKIYSWKFFMFFLYKKKLQEKPSTLKREHPALQNMKILYFFLFLWVIFCPTGSGFVFWMRIRIRIQQLILMRLHNPAEGEAFNPQKRTSNTSKHENSLPFFYFCGSFLPSWIRIRILNADPDPDPATQIDADPCGSGSGSTTLLTANVPAWWKACGKSRSPAPSAAFTIRNTEPSVLVPWTQLA